MINLNGYLWKVQFVRPDSPFLIDRNSNLTVATTDPITQTIYLSDQLYGDFLERVFIHEIGHCVMFSFGLIDDIHTMVYPEYWRDAEEWVCNYVANYGRLIFSSLDKDIMAHKKEKR